MDDILRIEKLKTDARQNYDERIKKKHMEDQEREQAFLVELESSSKEFQRRFIERVWEELQDCSLKGHFGKLFRFCDFRDKIGPVRVSTLVKGFHIQKNWDSSIFQKIGLDGTPFDQVVTSLKEKGVRVEDVSDTTKSLGFWVSIRFQEDT